ncbi:hypothetical protein HPB52_022715 [Rhipicephalus sanguineus]|uniref:Uncharacterized protein n=1 Tax=Rhipicephalus sanguineus TaxID=34632 RepID=A0A9D4T234_RHISA|nr:hypothetical protein HPB52_022715 [Rhipicephalus sanguineus]
MNFKGILDVNPTKARKQAAKFCDEVGLPVLAKSVKAARNLCLDVVFSVKNHKDGTHSEPSSLNVELGNGTWLLTRSRP